MDNGFGVIGTLARGDDLPFATHGLFTDSQDIAECRAHFGPRTGDEWTAVIVWAEDGDYVEIWATATSRPFDSDAMFQRVL